MATEWRWSHQGRDPHIKLAYVSHMKKAGDNDKSLVSLLTV